MPSQTQGQTLFRNLLLIESAMNVSSMVPMFLTPHTILAMLAPSHTLGTAVQPLSRTLIQWVGALVTLATVPLLLSYPNPADPSDKAQRAAVTEKRRLTYAIMGICEVVLSGTTAVQMISGTETGLKDGFLLSASGILGSLAVMRAFFLYVKPEWMEPAAADRKTK